MKFNLLLVAALTSTSLFADEWVQFDGGGCFQDDRTGRLHGCDFPENSQTTVIQKNVIVRPEPTYGYDINTPEGYCAQQRHILKIARQDFKRTIKSVREAEKRYDRTLCKPEARKVK